jgi:hypothetical protein
VTASWRPKSVYKSLVGKFTDGLSRQKILTLNFLAVYTATTSVYFSKAKQL